MERSINEIVIWGRVPTFWKVLECPGIVQNVLEINEFSGNLGLLKFGMMTVVPFL